MIPEKMIEVMKHAGVVAIATQGEDGPHLVNTWNSYLQITGEGRLLIPAGYFQKTEANIAQDNRVLITLGSHEVAGKNGPGTGFLVKGSAVFETSGPDFDSIKARFAWARAVVAVTVTSVTQTL
jgi:hypothetical protein